jgi:hypothetical protein
MFEKSKESPEFSKKPADHAHCSKSVPPAIGHFRHLQRDLGPNNLKPKLQIARNVKNAEST